MYYTWTGRSVAHFLAEFWLLLGKPLFNVANTIVYCVFILLLQFHIMGSLKNFNPLVFFCLNIFLWYFVPMWGQDFIWLTGSCNYLWTTVIILLFLVPFRKKIDDSGYRLNPFFSLLFFLPGVLAGWTNENSGAAVLFMLIAYFALLRIRKNKLSLFDITGTAGFITGFIFLVAAPGNYVRAISEQAAQSSLNGGFIIILFKRFLGITLKVLENYSFIIIALSVFLYFEIVHHKKKKIPAVTWLYALAGMASIYSMLLSPSFPDRTFFIVIVFWCLTLGTLLVRYEPEIPEIFRRNSKLILVSLFILFSSSFLFGARNTVGIYLKWRDRLQYIESEKQKGNFDIEVKAPIPATNRHTAPYRLDDISNDIYFWRNVDIAAYYGINSIKRINDDTPW